MNLACLYITTGGDPYNPMRINRRSAVGQRLFGPDGKGLPLYSNFCGGHCDHPLVDSCDDKHYMKRFRMTFKRSIGIRIHQHVFTQDLMTHLFKELPQPPSDKAISSMWGESSDTDAQNVPAAARLTLTLSLFAGMSANSFPSIRREKPDFDAWLKELRILAEYAGLLFEIVTTQDVQDAAHSRCTFLTVSQLATKGAALSHMAFVLFRQNGYKFVPPQHYYNTQITIRTKFNSIAHFQAKGLPYYFWYDDRLQGIFGCLRGLLNGPNVTAAGFEERASILMQMASIYAENPDWRLDGRRIAGVFFDHVNPFNILGVDRDYSKVTVRNVDLPTCWLNGRAYAVTVLTQCQGPQDPAVFRAVDVDFDVIARKNYNDHPARIPMYPCMLKPRGEWVGVLMKGVQAQEAAAEDEEYTKAELKLMDEDSDLHPPPSDVEEAGGIDDVLEHKCMTQTRIPMLEWNVHHSQAGNYQELQTIRGLKKSRPPRW
jgi:hypothetical protein